MSRATGIGSMPGEDQVAFDEAVRVVAGELGEQIPFVPEVPGRGAIAGMTGRTLALVTDLGIDLQPAGWRVSGPPESSGVDHRRARSLLAQDLDRVEEEFQEYAGPFKVQVAGPWTLAATVERPRADRVLADHGLRRDLAQALVEGVRRHVDDVRRRVRGAELIVQVDEPVLPAVLAGRVPTASGFHRHRSVDVPEASDTLGWLLAAIADAGAEPWVHACAPDVPWDVVRGAGARGLAVDLGVVGAAGHDVLATALEAGDTVVAGVVRAGDTDAAVVERVLRWLDMLGLDPAVVGERLVVAPPCGLAGSTPADARTALTLSRESAVRLASG